MNTSRPCLVTKYDTYSLPKVALLSVAFKDSLKLNYLPDGIQIKRHYHSTAKHEVVATLHV